ncbi:hypothetical protein FRC11_014161 [Ceratobasidium sp. 423]|nr:hypothetical protein FRC11_014161 [Ceratobasidium sp. 423]
MSLQVVVAHEKETGLCRGFAYVTFAYVQQAEEAAANMNDRELDGNRITAKVDATGMAACVIQ